MLIELKLCLESAALKRLSAHDLARLAEGIELPQADDAVRVAVEFAHGQTDPANYLTKGVQKDRRALVIVSPKLVEPTTDGCKASGLAQHILETSWRQQVVVGLVGVTELSDDRAIGLDAVIAPGEIKRDLRTVFQRLVHRLWFKLAPPQGNRRTRREQIPLEAQRVCDKASFRECLALRHRVYSSLGYLEADVAESAIKLDLDGYDTRAKHFVVFDRTANRVAATARLISPGASPLRSGLAQAPRYEDWCSAFAREEPGRVYRDLLKRRNLASLPIVDSFDYFMDLSDHQKYAYPQHACEVSRVVVHPDYRGYGILRVLMRRVIEEARRERKRYLLLECAPFHESMYRKFGFVTITKDGRSHYTRAQRLDSWAVAMHLDLNGEDHGSAGQSAFRMSLDAPSERPLAIEITDPNLDVQAIENCLRKPFVPPALRRPAAGRVAKSGHSPLLAHLRLGLGRPDEGLRDVIRELHARLPNANVRLCSASQVLQLGHARCPGSEACGSVLHELNNWLENLHGSA